MRKIVIIVLIFSLWGCKSQVSVVESSGRKPDWVNSLQKDYIIASGSASDINNAQQNALNMIKERIVNSVAERVRTTSDVKIEEKNFNNEINRFLESYTRTTTTETGQVPYLQGISLSRAEDYFWEKTRNRNTGQEIYNYHIKYPFSDMELQKLVIDFNMRDKQLSIRLDEILEKIDHITKLEDIEKYINELRVLSGLFTDSRKDLAQLGITRLQNIYKNVNFEILEHRQGILKYRLKLNNQLIETSQRPRLNSECARIKATQSIDDFTMINYDYSDCYEDINNYIKVAYRFGNHSVEENFSFDITADKVEVFVNDPINFSALQRSEDVIEKANINMSVVSKYDSPFTIERVILEFRNHSPVMISNIGQTFSGSGNHFLQMETTQNLQIETTTTQGSGVNMISGQIFYRAEKTGENKTYRIYNVNYSTDW